MIKLRPEDYEAYLIRATLRLQTVERNHTEQLERMLSRHDLPWHGMVQLRYAAAKEYENIGEYDRSFFYLSSGASLRWRHIKYDIGEDLQVIEKIINAIDAQVIDSADNSMQGEGTIFIVALPRTGSTLLERMLGSHSDLFSAGELNTFPRETANQLRGIAASKHLSKTEILDLTTRLDFGALGRAYMETARVQLGHTKRFTNKLPLNFQYHRRAAKTASAAQVRRTVYTTSLHQWRHYESQLVPLRETLVRGGIALSGADAR